MIKNNNFKRNQRNKKINKIGKWNCGRVDAGFNLEIKLEVRGFQRGLNDIKFNKERDGWK